MASLSYNGYRFELFCTQAEGMLAKEMGFHWDYLKKCWWTGLVDIARVFVPWADGSAKAKFDEFNAQVNLSRATDANIVIPVPNGLSYLPFQKAGIAYAVSRPITLIADQMGLGKTIQTIGVINYDPTIKKVLVICPASLKINWGRELMKWIANKKLSGGFVYGNDFPDTDIVIINYDIVNKWRWKIDSIHWDLVIGDEIHYCKNTTSQRSRAVLGWISQSGKTSRPPIIADRRIYLTGTPILNRPIELWPLIRIADPEGLGSSFWGFAKTYCKAWEAPWGWDFSGCAVEKMSDLQQRLRAKFMIRRLKSEVLKDLPTKRRQIIPIPGGDRIAAVQQELLFYNQNNLELHIEEMELSRAIAEQEQVFADQQSYKEATLGLRTANKARFDKMASLRHATAIAKLPYVISYIVDMMEQEEKIVVFCHHRDLVEGLRKRFEGCCVVMHGGMKMPERQQAVDRFQNEDGVKLIIGTIGTMGEGWTLTRAAYVLFAELDWVPGKLNQCEDRLHRIGQQESVLIHHLVFDGSLDANMAKMLVEKQEKIEAALD